MENPAQQIARLGIVGGTFDPPHWGHLVLGQNGLTQLELDLVAFVPARQPPHKPEQPVTPVHHRVAMVELAIEHNAAFFLSQVDVERSGPHYTVDMLGLLQDAYPGAALFFLMGGDSLAEFGEWREPSGILEQARLGVMRRPGWEADTASLIEELPALQDRLRWLDVPHLAISGTDLRRRVAEGMPIRYLVPEAVRAYVHRCRLYRRLSDTQDPKGF